MQITIDTEQLRAEAAAIEAAYAAATPNGMRDPNVSNTVLRQWQYRMAQAAQRLRLIETALAYVIDVVDQGYNPGNPGDWDGMGDIDGRQLERLTAASLAHRYEYSVQALEEEEADRRSRGRDD